MKAAVDSETDPRVQTYQYLRLMLVLPIVFLLLATVFEAVERGGFRQSISDSYQGPVRDVFVGVLMASGVCMIAYKGRSKLEDYTLNFAGFNGFFVALVPNNFTEVLGQAATTSVTTGDVATHDQVLSNLRFVLAALLITSAVFISFDRRLMNWSGFRWGKDETRFASTLVVISAAAELLLLIIVAVVLLGHETVFGVGIFSLLHLFAASLLIGNLSFAVASHAFPETLRNSRENGTLAPSSPRVRRTYRMIVVAMWLGLLVGGTCIWRQVPYSMLVTEYAEIGLFVAYWVVATRKDWTQPVSSAKEANAAAV